MAIQASNPVVVPGTSETTFDQWYMTQLIVKASPEKVFTVVHLNRSASVDGQVVLMDGKNSDTTFSLDILKEMAGTPELAAAMEAVTSAVIAYATKKNLI